MEQPIINAIYYPTRGGLGEKPRRVVAVFGERVKYETLRCMMEVSEDYWREWVDEVSPAVVESS